MAERPEDLNLPAAVVTRIVRDALPSQVKVSKEANAAIAKAASVFVLYATSCANNVALKANRKTLHGNDVIQAMKDMEFDKFVKPLDLALEGWKSGQAKKKEETAKRKKDKASAEAEVAKKQGDGKKDENDDDDDDSVQEIKRTKTGEDNKENEDDDDSDEIQEIPQD